MRRLRLALVLAVVLLLLAACGGDDDGDQAAAPEDPATVAVIDNEFDPKEVSVATGDTVTWRFEGAAVHNVTFEDEALESSSNLKEGTFEQTFDEAGSYEYTCTLHPGMDGTVTVTG